MCTFLRMLFSILLNEIIFIFIDISLNFVREGPIAKTSALI